MGWGRGSSLMSGIIESAKLAIPNDGVRAGFYKDVIPAFEDLDCDNLFECEEGDEVFKATLRELHPEWEDDE